MSYPFWPNTAPNQRYPQYIPRNPTNPQRTPEFYGPEQFVNPNWHVPQYYPNGVPPQFHANTYPNQAPPQYQPNVPKIFDGTIRRYPSWSPQQYQPSASPNTSEVLNDTIDRYPTIPPPQYQPNTIPNASEINNNQDIRKQKSSQAWVSPRAQVLKEQQSRGQYKTKQYNAQTEKYLLDRFNSSTKYFNEKYAKDPTIAESYRLANIRINNS
jgi:hypothetical protein